MTAVLGAEVEAMIARWSPRRASPEAAAFARAALARCAPSSVSRAKDLLFACARLGTFGQSVGLELSPEVLLHPSVIERFVLVNATTVSGATRRTLRSNLRLVARGGRSDAEVAASPLRRELAKAPYSSMEIDGFLRRARTQSTEARRRRCTALVCVGAGAGLRPEDLRHLRGRDVVERSGGVLVSVHGPRPRSVPVLARYHDALLEAAAFAGGDYLCGGTDASRRNVTGALNASIEGGSGLPRLDVGRLRSTWLEELGRRLGLRAFMDAAGIICSQRLGDVIATLESFDEPDCVHLLGGKR